MNFLDLEINQKNYIKILILCIFLVGVIIVSYYITLLTYKSFTLEESTSLEPNSNLNVHIDILEYQGKKAEIVGYAYMKDETITTIDCSYILKSQTTGKMYKVKTRREKNENVPEVYSVSGIHTRFLTYGLEEGRYDIFVLYKNNEHNILASTGIYIDI